MRIERLRVYGRVLPNVGAKRRTSWARLLRQVYLVIRSAVLWIVSILHFFPVCTFLVILGMFIDPRKNDRPQRWFFRNVLRLAGVRFQVRYAPGFDPPRSTNCIAATAVIVFEMEARRYTVRSVAGTEFSRSA